MGLVIQIFFEKVSPLLLQTTDNANPVDFELQKDLSRPVKKILQETKLDQLQKTSLDQLQRDQCRSVTKRPV